MCRNGNNGRAAEVSAAINSILGHGPAAEVSADLRPIVGQFTFADLMELPRIVPIRADLRQCSQCERDCYDYVERMLCEDGTLPINSREVTVPTILCDNCDSKRFAECYDCNELLDREDSDNCRTDDEGDSYCDSCYCERYTSCEGCSNEISRSDCNTSQAGDSYCDECYSERFSHCEWCSSEFDSDSGHCVNDCELICDSCYERHYTTCDDCGNELRCDDAHDIEGDGNYCENCYCDNSCSCDDCGDTFHNDNITSLDDGNYCSECAEEHTCDVCEDGECDCSAADLRERAEQRRAQRAAERERERAAEAQRAEAQRAERERAAQRAARRYWQGAQFNPDSTDCAIVGSHRTFAVEIETAECPGHEDFQGRFAFNCESDGSISGEEFPSAVLHDDAGLDAISDFLGAANDAEWSVDSKCGTHAHFGVGDLSVEQLKSVAYAYKVTEEVWRGFVSKSRRETKYCQAVKWGERDLERISDSVDFCTFAKNQGDNCRYQWINWGAYTKTKGNNGEYRKTVECRLHGGTLNAEKLRNWVVAHVRFIEFVKDMTFEAIADTFDSRPTVATVGALLAIFPAEVSADLRARFVRFNPDSTLAADLRAAEVSAD